MREITELMKKHLEEMKQVYCNNEKIYRLYENGIKNTFLTTLNPKANGETFVITGDIPAMWLRDSAAQVRPLLIFAKEDKVIRDMITGVIGLQMKQIQIDPYANAFNDGATGEGHQEDRTMMRPEIWERKYEIDSLCYPVQLAYLFWKSTDNTDHFNEDFIEACNCILEVFKREQRHLECSEYRFEREEDEEERIIFETLPYEGSGNPVDYTGMTWSGFRPSDDACQYGYLVPSNMFAVVILRYMSEIANVVIKDRRLAEKAEALSESIDKGIQTYAKIIHPKFGEVFAYEVDGRGNYLLMDDANVPSLLSIPYLGYCRFDDPVYLNTRKMILSTENPYYFCGIEARGIGSPHTPKGYFWPIALAVQGMTAQNQNEKEEVLNLLCITDAATDLMHESIDVNNPYQFTRPWFSWANSMFAEFVLLLNQIAVKGSPLWHLINQ